MAEHLTGEAGTSPDEPFQAEYHRMLGLKMIDFLIANLRNNFQKEELPVYILPISEQQQIV